MQTSAAKGSEHKSQRTLLHCTGRRVRVLDKAETSDLTELIFQCGDADKK